jgi:hypothetical protein
LILAVVLRLTLGLRAFAFAMLISRGRDLPPPCARMTRAPCYHSRNMQRVRHA